MPPDFHNSIPSHSTHLQIFPSLHAFQVHSFTPSSLKFSLLELHNSIPSSSKHLQSTHLSLAGAQVRPAFNLSASRRVQQPSWMTERRTTFKSSKKSKKVKLSMWEHEFKCLACCGEATPMENAELIKAGLGPHKLILLSMVTVGNSTMM